MLVLRPSALREDRLQKSSILSALNMRSAILDELHLLILIVHTTVVKHMQLAVNHLRLIHSLVVLNYGRVFTLSVSILNRHGMLHVIRQSEDPTSE